MSTKAKYIIDPGHGGKDPGAVGGWLTEAKVVLDISKRVKRLLEEAGYEVVLTRVDDTIPSWNARVELAEKEDLFISIHCDSFIDPNANGSTVFHYPGSVAGEAFAQKVNEEIAKIPGLRDRGVKTGTWWVLRKTKCPAILVECAFISNAQDRKLHLETDAGRQRLADAIATGAIKAR